MITLHVDLYQGRHVSSIDGNNHSIYTEEILSTLLAVKMIFLGGKGEFSEAPRFICTSYFLPPKGKMFWAILDTEN